MRQPLIPVALLYVTGILLAALPMPLTAIFAVAFCCGLICLFWQGARTVLLCVLIVLTGWINLAHRTAVLSPNDLRTRFSKTEQWFSVRGILCETPLHRVHEIKDKEILSSMVLIDVLETRSENGDWLPAHGRIMTRTRELLHDNFFAGQTIEVTGLLQPARGPVAEGLFDYHDYLNHQGIDYEMDIDKATAWQIIATASHPPLADRFTSWARKALALGLPAEDETLQLEWALTLGWKAALTQEVSEPFIRAATYHVFAVDGLRIAIITAILFTILRLARIPRAYCGILAMPLILFYAAMTGWPASAIRAIVMIGVVFGGWVLNRPSNLMNSLFVAALIILTWEPRELFQAGFQLSFFVVLCIILILPFFTSLGQKMLRRDPFLPEALQPKWKKVLQMPLRYVVDLFLTSIAAWLGSIPLVAWYFHITTPWSGPANVLAVPLCALVLITNLASLLFAGWFTWPAILFNHAGWFFMECLRASSNWFAHWPGAYFYVAKPTWFTIALYYLVLLAALTGWLFKGEKKTWKISGIVFLILIWCCAWVAERPVTEMTILPLRGGHAIYASAGDNWNDWLIDCGNDTTVESIVKPFLEAQGVNRLSNLLLTHGEINYSGGASAICETFNPQNIYSSTIHFRSPEFRRFEDKAKDKPAWRMPLKIGDQTDTWSVLYPLPQSTTAKAEDNVMVLRGSIRGTRVLLLSDLSHAGQISLLATGQDLRAEIVIAGMPDDGEPLCDALLAAIQPNVIIVADSPQPAKKKAGEKLLRRLSRTHALVISTSATDAVTVSFRKDNWKLRAMNGTAASNNEMISAH